MNLRESLEALTQKWLKNGHSAFANSLHEAFDVPLSELEAELAAARELIKQQDEELANALKYSTELLKSARELGPWKCKANPTADPPQDCDFPFCGCDPNAIKVIETLQESGWIGPKESCDREKAATAAALRHAADTVNRARGTSYDLRGIVASILALITPDQSAALAERKRKTEEILLRAMLIAQNFGTLKR